MTFKAKPTFIIKRIAAPELRADFSNLKDLPLPALKTYLAGPEKQEIARELLTQMQSIARAGTGLRYEEIPEPERQQGLSCATMLLINGVITVGGKKYIIEEPTELAKRIRSIVETENEKTELVNRRGSDFSMRTNSRYFPEVGIPLYPIETPFNPVRVTELMFQKNRFLGFSDGSSFHAFCIVPLADATHAEFAVKLDSLSGRKSVLSLIEFAKMLLTVEIISKTGWKDDNIVYELGEK